MLKRFSNNILTFGSFFVEAPGDDTDTVSVTVAPRKNRGTDYGDTNATNTNVTVAPRVNRGEDYTQDADTEDAESQEPEAEPENTSEEPQDDAAEAPDEGEEATDYGADGDAEGEDVEGPDTGDDEATDYTDDAATGDEPEAEADSDNTEMTDEEKKDASKKYYMYRRFMHLYSLLETFIEKCKGVVKSDAAQNAVVKTVTNNFSALYDNMFDYMTIRYKSATYIQILLYFETAISIILLNFELLKNNKINLKQ